MTTFLLWASLALCLFALWAIGRQDWVRLTRARCRAFAEVVGHRTNWEDGQRTYAAVLHFTYSGGQCEVTDQVLHPRPTPEVGTIIEVQYPEGRPELARRPRAILWTLIYVLLVTLSAVIVARIFDLLPR